MNKLFLIALLAIVCGLSEAQYYYGYPSYGYGVYGYPSYSVGYAYPAYYGGYYGYGYGRKKRDVSAQENRAVENPRFRRFLDLQN